METKEEKKPTPPETATPKPGSTLKFYKKELISNRLTLPNGRAVQFEQIGDSDSGLLATTDPALSAELDKAAAAGRGGLISITEPQYQELKKNPTARRSQIKSLDAQSLRHLLASQNRASAPVVVEANQESSAPMAVEKGLATISSRRKLKEMQEKQAASV